jgi:hypothetical protein
MYKLLAIGLAALVFPALAQMSAATQERPKWFVLRDHEIGSCWPALLIEIDGIYRHGFAQTAGGPYDTEEQALDRRRALQANGTCVE